MTDSSMYLPRRPARHPGAGWPDQAAYRGLDPDRSALIRTEVWPGPTRTGAEPDRTSTMLRGRRSECAVLGGLLDGVRGGRGAVLV
ncbi:MAG TPA: hypothetical protein VHO07_27250, partial [Streptosporangiaceae bacterium]|nr:hypothetical protein [Streptosporangiaceae bacterium]